MQTFVHKRAGSGALVSDLEPLAGGASCNIYAFDYRPSEGEAARSMVLRMDSEGGSVQGDRAEEFALLAATRKAGVTVPRVYWKGADEEGLGGSFFVMERVAGEAIARRLLRDERYARTRKALPAQLACELALIHGVNIDLPELAFLRDRQPDGGGAGHVLEELERYKGMLAVAAAGHPYPVLTMSARWLAENAPRVDKPALVHGDFRIGNVMFDEQGLTAVLDWELAHIGDPMEDLGWLCVRAWRFGVDELHAGGLCTREEICRLYSEASGHEVDRDLVCYWEIFGNWKWAAICVLQGARHKAGRRPDIELASIGRRVAASELEVLELLGRERVLG